MLAIVCCGSVFAQDRIHLVDSRRVIEAKIIEIGEVDIIYKLYNNLDGPDYRLSVSRIESIDFENGTRQVFADGRRLATGPYVDGYMDGYDDRGLDYRWGHYYMHDRRLRRQELTDYIGYSLYGGKYRKASNQYMWGMILTGLGVFAVTATTMDLIFSNKENTTRIFRMSSSRIILSATLPATLSVMLPGQVASERESRFGSSPTRLSMRSLTTTTATTAAAISATVPR